MKIETIKQKIKEGTISDVDVKEFIGQREVLSDAIKELVSLNMMIIEEYVTELAEAKKENEQEVESMIIDFTSKQNVFFQAFDFLGNIEIDLD